MIPGLGPDPVFMISRTSPAGGRGGREDLSAAVSVSFRAARVSSQPRMISWERVSLTRGLLTDLDPDPAGLAGPLARQVRRCAASLGPVPGPSAQGRSFTPV